MRTAYTYTPYLKLLRVIDTYNALERTRRALSDSLRFGPRADQMLSQEPTCDSVNKTTCHEGSCALGSSLSEYRRKERSQIVAAGAALLRHFAPRLPKRGAGTATFSQCSRFLIP
jgi:hypothetical protein